MYRFDCVLLNPTPAVLSRVLGDASAAANKGCRTDLLQWPPSDFGEFVTAWQDAPEGQRQWNSPRGFAAAVVWWSDPLGRKHCRVVLDADGRLLGAFRWHQGDINAVAFSPDGRWLATGGNEDRVKLWPVEGLLGSRATLSAPRRRKRS